MINTKFINFKVELLLESVLEAEPNFFDVLKNMTPSKHRDIILRWIHYKKDDVTTKYNLLSPSGTEADKILYFQDGQFQRFKQTSADLSSRPKSDTTVGRFIRSILSDNKIPFTEKDISDFVDNYRISWSGIFQIEQDKEDEEDENFRIVKGKDINFWYLEENYFSDPNTRSELMGSCMRYKHLNSRMDLYSTNPDLVSMMIHTIDVKVGDKIEKKLLARALVWKTTDGGTYVDRIYFSSQESFDNSVAWLRKKFPGALYHYVIKNSSTLPKISVNLKNFVFYRYPYMDSLPYLCMEIEDDKIKSDSVGTLSSYPICKNMDDDIMFTLKQHDTGLPKCLTHKFWSDTKEWIPNDSWTLVYKGSDHLPKKYTKFSKIYDQYIEESQSVWSDYLSDYLYLPDVVDYPGIGLVDKNYIKIVYDDFLGDYKLYPWQKFELFKNEPEKYFSKKTQVIKRISGKKSYFEVEYLPGNYWSNWYLDSDIHDKKSISLFNIPVYKIDPILVKKELISRYQENPREAHWYYMVFDNLFRNGKGGSYITLCDAKIFDVVNLLDKEEYISPEEYIYVGNYISIELMQHLLNQTSTLSQEDKKWRLSLHKWVISQKNDPRFKFDGPFDPNSENKEISILKKEMVIFYKNVFNIEDFYIELRDFILKRPSRGYLDDLVDVSGNEIVQSSKRWQSFIDGHDKYLQTILFWFLTLYKGDSVKVRVFLLDNYHMIPPGKIPHKVFISFVELIRDWWYTKANTHRINRLRNETLSFRSLELWGSMSREEIFNIIFDIELER